MTATNAAIAREQVDAVIALQQAEIRQRPYRSPVASDEILAAYAMRPALTRGEAVAILQGLTPPVPSYEDEGIYYLDEHVAVVQRYLADCARGAIASPCMPAELVAWADEIGAMLPKAFSEVARTPPTSTQRWDDASARPLAEHASDDRIGAEFARVEPSLGSTSVSNDDARFVQQAIESAARDFLKERGRLPTKQEAAKRIAAAVGKDVPRIMRIARRTWKCDGRSKGVRLKSVRLN